jgi:hypothetical protein
MGAQPVVVLSVDAERPVKMAPPEDQRPVEALGPDLSITRSAWAFAFGARTGVRITRIASNRTTVPNGPVNFASRSRTGNRTGLLRASSPSARLRACWVTQAESGCTVEGLTWIRRLPSSMNTRT